MDPKTITIIISIILLFILLIIPIDLPSSYARPAPLEEQHQTCRPEGDKHEAQQGGPVRSKREVHIDTKLMNVCG